MLCKTVKSRSRDESHNALVKRREETFIFNAPGGGH